MPAAAGITFIRQQHVLHEVSAVPTSCPRNRVPATGPGLNASSVALCRPATALSGGRSRNRARLGGQSYPWLRHCITDNSPKLTAHARARPCAAVLPVASSTVRRAMETLARARALGREVTGTLILECARHCRPVAGAGARHRSCTRSVRGSFGTCCGVSRLSHARVTPRPTRPGALARPVRGRGPGLPGPALHHCSVCVCLFD